MTTNCHWHEFTAPDDLADALAGRVATELRRAIEARGHALLAVSGGRTPVRFFQVLSEQMLDWAKVTVTLVDERFVPPTSDRSNERLVSAHLLQTDAAAAHFVSLFTETATIEEASRAAGKRVADLPLPFDAVILGMGTDGHTASFFPDAENLEALLDPTSRDCVLPVYANSAGELRLTLPLARLIEAQFIALHIEGSEKKNVLQSALLGADRRLPVSAVFDHSKHPLQIYWAPDKEKES